MQSYDFTALDQMSVAFILLTQRNQYSPPKYKLNDTSGSLVLSSVQVAAYIAYITRPVMDTTSSSLRLNIEMVLYGLFIALAILLG